MKKILSLGLITSVLFLAGCTSSEVSPEIKNFLTAHKPLTVEEAKSTEKNIVEIFSDMQCGHCKNLDPTIQKLEADLPSVDFKFYHFPFLGSQSFPAAVAIECVRLQDEKKANGYITTVFNAKNLSSSSLRSMAKETGVDEEKFATCLKKKQTASLINNFLKEGDERGISSTPSIFINGVIYSGNRDYETLKTFLSQPK